MPGVVTSSLVSHGLVVAFAGQSLIERRVDCDADPRIASVAKLVGSADAAMTNLECALLGRHGGWPTRDATLHVAPPDVLDTLTAFGFDVLALASNHAFDLGPPGVATALEEVKARGFLHAGLGADPSAAIAVGVGIRRGRELALVAVNASPKPEASGARAADGAMPARPGTFVLRVEPSADDGHRAADPVALGAVLSAIRDATSGTGLAVAYVHQHYWEDDPAHTPRWLVDVAHRCVEAGADAVVVHGPPVLHGMEIYAGRPIFFGLSSFVFHTAQPARYPGADAWESLVARCTFSEDGRVLAVALHPIVVGSHPSLSPTDQALGAPFLPDPETAAAVLWRFARRAALFSTEIEVDCAGVGHVALHSS